MISAFLLNSKFLCSLYHSTVDSFVFCDFVKLLKYSLTKPNIDIKTQVVVVLDNASYHWSAQTIEWYKHHGISVEFLPPYWPNLAPVETLFKFIKSRVKNCELESLWILETNWKKDDPRSMLTNIRAGLTWGLGFVYTR